MDDSPIDPVIVQRAIEWMARLWSGEASDADKAACQQWRMEHPSHERAWSRLQIMENKLHSVPREIARHALYEPKSHTQPARRRVLKLLGLTIVAGGAMHLEREHNIWQIAFSDYSTQTGEIRKIMLSDGTRLVLGTATAIDVRFDDLKRRVFLRSGEILVITAPDSAIACRPFQVQSRHGTVEALGTSFTVRQTGNFSDAAVFDGAVEIRPNRAMSAAMRIDNGQRTVFSAEHVEPPIAVHKNAAAWTTGKLVVENMRVADFVAELERYRVGILRCDPAIADLQVTGVFSLHDTDRALHNLTFALPIRIIYRTPYWVTVQQK
ncbi:MAG: FecR domain-containing protein [Nitrosomonas sp.]|nr:MAG: FecR domain-containing protein [Nitrosomonas sp.]